MSLKSRIFGVLVAMAIVISLIVVGVIAATKTDVKVGGNVKFNADGVVAKIELVSLDNGNLTNGIIGVDRLKTVELNNQTSKQDLEDAFSTWADLELEFAKRDGTPITLQVKITNMAEAEADNYIDLTVDVEEGVVENCIIDAVNENDKRVDLLAPQEYAIFTISFDVEDEWFTASLTDFEINFNMEKKTKSEFPMYADGLVFEYVDEDTQDKLRTYWDGDTEFDGTVYVPKYVNYENKILPVTNIGVSAFEACQSLTDISLPQTLDIVEENAFDYTENLATISFPYGVKSIESCFQYSTGLENVEISSSVETIGNYTFTGCTGLTSITIPYSVKTIGESAFDSCTNLKTVKIEEGLKNIGDCAFAWCTSLKSITIPASVTSVVDGCLFAWCDNLESINVAEGNTVYNSKNNCNAIIETATNTLIAGCKTTVVPNTVIHIGPYAFEGCYEMTEISIPDSVETIGECAFEGCENLETIKLGKRVSSIEGDAFTECFSLTTAIITSETIMSSIEYEYSYGYLPEKASVLKFPTRKIGKLNDFILDNYYEGGYTERIDGVEYTTYSGRGLGFGYSETPDNAYVYWDHETELYGNLIIPETVKIDGVIWTVKYLDGDAFYDTNYLSKIILPSTLTSMGYNAFPEDYTYNKISDEDAGCYVGTKDNPYFLLAKMEENVSEYNVHPDCTILGDYLFADNEELVDIQLNEKLKYINAYAFEDCTNLKKISIPDSIELIEYYVFDGCTSLEFNEKNNAYYLGNTQNPYLVLYEAVSIDVATCQIDETCKIICNEAFVNCAKLESITIPSNVKNIGDNAFLRCTNLQTIYVDSENKVYDSRENCNALIETATNTLLCCCNNSFIPDSVTNIHYNAFKGCISLESITIPDSVTSLNTALFSNCTGLKTLILGDGVKSLPILTSCTSLETLVIGDGVKSIAQKAFENMTSLKNVTLGNGITSIGRYAFNECTGLVSVTIGSGVTSIIEGAFANCTSLESINIPDSVTSMEGWVFYDCTSLVNIVIGKNVTSIGSFTFLGCESLKTVIIGSETIASQLDGVGDAACGFLLLYTTTVKVKSSIVEAGKLNSFVTDNFVECDIETINGVDYTVFEKGFIFIEEDGGLIVADNHDVTEGGVIRIPSSAVYNGVRLPVVEIGDFSSSYITGVIIPASIQTISSGSFDECSYLTSIVVEEGNNVYDSRDNCNAIIETATNTLIRGCNNTIIPDSVTSIGERAFTAIYMDCIKIPASVKSIGPSAFGHASLSTAIIDSETIASQLDGEGGDDCGYLLNYAKTVKVLTNIVNAGKLHSYVTENFTTVTTETIDGVEYTVYSKASA